MAVSVGDERKDYELKKETELRLEVDENQQVVIRVSERRLLRAGSLLVVYGPLQSKCSTVLAFSFSWLALVKHNLFYIRTYAAYTSSSLLPLSIHSPSPFTPPLHSLPLSIHSPSPFTPPLHSLPLSIHSPSPFTPPLHSLPLSIHSPSPFTPPLHSLPPPPFSALCGPISWMQVQLRCLGRSLPEARSISCSVPQR